MHPRPPLFRDCQQAASWPAPTFSPWMPCGWCGVTQQCGGVLLSDIALFACSGELPRRLFDFKTDPASFREAVLCQVLGSQAEA